MAEVARERERGGTPCRRVRELAAGKLSAAEHRLADLERLVRTLRSLLDDWDARLAATPAGRRAHLLDGLLTDDDPGPTR